MLEATNSYVDVSERTLSTLESDMEASHRPYPFLRIDIERVEEDPLYRSNELPIVMDNAGGSPARNVQFFHRLSPKNYNVEQIWLEEETFNVIMRDLDCDNIADKACWYRITVPSSLTTYLIYPNTKRRRAMKDYSLDSTIASGEDAYLYIFLIYGYVNKTHCYYTKYLLKRKCVQEIAKRHVWIETPMLVFEDGVEMGEGFKPMCYELREGVGVIVTISEDRIFFQNDY